MKNIYRSVFAKHLLPIFMLFLLISTIPTQAYVYFKIPLDSGDKMVYEITYKTGNKTYRAYYTIAIEDVILTPNGKKYKVSFIYDNMTASMGTTKYIMDYEVLLYIPLSIEKNKVRMSFTFPVPGMQEPATTADMPRTGVSISINTVVYELVDYEVDKVAGIKRKAMYVEQGNMTAYIDRETGLLIEYSKVSPKSSLHIKLIESNVLRESTVVDNVNEKPFFSLSSAAPLIVLITIIVVIAGIMVYKLISMYGEFSEV